MYHNLFSMQLFFFCCHLMFFFLYITAKKIIGLRPVEMLLTLYKILAFGYIEDFISDVATVRGKLKKGGILANDVVAIIILQVWNEGLYFKNFNIFCQMDWVTGHNMLVHPF